MKYLIIKQPCLMRYLIVRKPCLMKCLRAIFPKNQTISKQYFCEIVRKPCLINCLNFDNHTVSLTISMTSILYGRQYKYGDRKRLWILLYIIQFQQTKSQQRIWLLTTINTMYDSRIIFSKR